jgi:hypothetical protein
MRYSANLFVAIGLGLAIAGCGGDDPSASSDNVPASAEPFTGSFVGSEQATQAGTTFQQAVTLTLVQSGSVVTGTYSASLGDAGSVNGTADGNNISLSITSTECQATLSGAGTLSGNALTGSLSALTFGICPGPLTATVTLVKR